MTDTKTIIEALRMLARDLKGIGADERLISEAADRLQKQQRKIRNQRREIEALQKDKKRVDGFVNWLNAEIGKCQHPMSDALSNRLWALLESRKQLQMLRNGLGEQ